MSKQVGENQRVVIPAGNGLELAGYPLDRSRSERFALKDRTRTFGGVALRWDSKGVYRVDYNLRDPQAHGSYLTQALPALAGHVFAERDHVYRLVTRLGPEINGDTDAYQQAITAAGFRMARINNRLSITTFELLRDSLDEDGQPVIGMRRPPVQVYGSPRNEESIRRYMDMPNQPPSTYEELPIIKKTPLIEI